MTSASALAAAALGSASDSPVESITDYVAKKIATTPDEIVTEGEHDEHQLIPGLPVITFYIAKGYQMKWKEIGQLQRIMKLDVYQPHVVQTPVGIHVVRGFRRIEWARIQKAMMTESKDIDGLLKSQGEDANWIRQNVEFHIEERLVIEGSVYPTYDKISVRELPTGTVTLLSNTILQASGNTENPLPAIPLK